MLLVLDLEDLNGIRELKRLLLHLNEGIYLWVILPLFQSVGSDTSYRLEEQLRALDAPPCHHQYITGRCIIRECKYGHKYILSEQQIGQLMILARRLVSGSGTSWTELMIEMQHDKR